MKEKVKDYLDEIAKNQGICLDNNTNLFETGILDSLGIIMLITYIMDELKIKLDVEDLKYENYETLKSIYAWLDEIL